MRMHSLCLICVSNGWLSTCNLLLEKSAAGKNFSFAKITLGNEVLMAVQFSREVDCNAFTVIHFILVSFLFLLHFFIAGVKSSEFWSNFGFRPSYW